MRYILIPLTLPMFIFGYLYVALFTLLTATRRHRFDPKMWTWECVWAPWVVKPRTWIKKNPLGRLFIWEEGGSWAEDSYNAVFNTELNGKKGRWIAVPTSHKKLPDREYARNIWKYGTTLSYGIIYAPRAIPEDDTTEADTRHEKHEDVHVLQVQDLVTLGFFVGLAVAIGMWVNTDAGTGFAWWAAIWMSSVAWQAPNFLTALLRGGNPYRDSEHERSAYAQTDTHHVRDGKSWLDRHLEKDRKF